MGRDEPSRNAYLKDELRNILAALHTTTASSLDRVSDEYSEAYLKGYTDALRSMSIALGLVPRITKGSADPRRVWLASDSVQSEEDSWR